MKHVAPLSLPFSELYSQLNIHAIIFNIIIQTCRKERNHYAKQNEDNHIYYRHPHHRQTKKQLH
ncbi:hypothetical protein [Lactobacillus crispatus]|uniref:hypothetical protein n=1 Tax=Lactobacillus crispatus TaxID=47770 RepID=UPI0018E2E258|nr:hypothetical protein [Lactobacillus crispatus]